MDFLNGVKNHFDYLSNEDVAILAELASYRRLKKREVFISVGSTAPVVAFVLAGIIRGYYCDQDGVERTIFLSQKNLFVGAPDTILYEQPTKYNFEAEVDSEILLFDAKALIECGLTCPGIGRMVIDAFSEIIKTLLGRLEAMIEKLPATRLEELALERPDFFEAARDKHLANYLGISPVSFSRIKKRNTDKS